jgi:hypothetical protein
MVVVALGLWALRAQKPVAFFVLRDVEAPEAFRVEVTLGSGESHVAAIALTRDQRRSAMDVLKDRDNEKLERFAKDLGDFHAVVGLTGTEGAWPSFWGAGPVFAADAEFDNLTWADRAYLSMGTRPTSPAPGMAPIAEKPTPTEPKHSPTPMATAPTAATTASAATAAAPLLVEIRNGCGITGAAEWVSRRLKAVDAKVVATGNADNFRYPQTLVRTNVTSAPALDAILDRLGLDRSKVSSLDPAVPGVDVVIVVGRDIRKLKKEKWR